jgi:hypothetical protein
MGQEWGGIVRPVVAWTYDPHRPGTLTTEQGESKGRVAVRPRGPTQLWIGVPTMAVQKTATTQKKPARAPRKPAKAAMGDQGGKAAQKRATGRQRAAKPNPFDDIARQVNADQEAKDREAGRDDLTPALAKSVDQAKANRSGTSRVATKPAKPARPATPATPAKPVKPTVPTKVQANGKPTTTFKGRPTSNPDTIAARAKEAGLRVRKDADVDDIASRLRATVEATAAWLASRNGQAPAKATPKAKPASKTDTAKPKADDKPTHIDVEHAWEGPVPDGMPELKGASLVLRYEVRPGGEVWSALWSIRDPDGQHMQEGWKLPMDFRWHAETLGNGRKVKLKGEPTRPALQLWLVQQGLLPE